MFDRSFLSKPLLEFVVVADTHYMLDTQNQPVEFESRRQQTARAEYVFRRIADLNPAFVIHLGDLVQEFPETADFPRAMTEAQQQLERCSLKPYQVAGNHDVGDKPDPTMPTAWVTTESLHGYHNRFGRSWYSWDEGGCHFIVLNSQILNANLPESDQQRQWLEADLQSNRAHRLFLFLHLAPFLCDPDEPAFGHYDNVAPPARGWLLDLLKRYQVELMFSAHSHFAFFNRIDETRHYGAVSPSFTRPGFSELFGSEPPLEQGRNDVDKLGFYLVRVHETVSHVHFIRTNGRVEGPDQPLVTSVLLTNITPDLPTSPLGVTLTHPLAHTTDVPLAWPSIIRQPVRNDYPFLSCIEAGVQHLRVPSTDLADPLQCERLSLLRDEGCQVTATWLSAAPNTLFEAGQRYRDHIDTIEVQIPGERYPDSQLLSQIQRCQTELNISVSLNTIIPRESVPGKQHLRTRIGYRLAEIEKLNEHLARTDVAVDRVLCHMDAGASLSKIMTQAEKLADLDQIRHLDWLISFATLNDRMQANIAAEALFSMARRPGARIYFSPMVDLDRTMDVTNGLLTRLCNPRLIFQVIRCLNTMLYSRPTHWEVTDVPPVSGYSSLGMTHVTRFLWLLMPIPTQEKATIRDSLFFQSFASTGYDIQLYDFVRGTVEPVLSDCDIYSDAPFVLQFSKIQ